MSWLVKISSLTSDQIKQQYSEFYKQLRQERDFLFSQIPTNHQTYYDAALSDHQMSVIRRQQDQKMLQWLQNMLPEAIKSGDQFVINEFRNGIDNIQQYLNVPLRQPNKQDVESYFDKDIFEFYADKAKNMNDLIPFLEKTQANYGWRRFSTGKKILVVDIDDEKYVVEDGNSQIHYSEANDWINNASEYPGDYFKDYSESYWDQVHNGDLVYHATTEENIETILKEGLLAGDKTRGISNRSTGAAVFASENIDEISSYGDIVLSINIGQMKSDGYMPHAQREEPVIEADIKNALASSIGLDDYQEEYDSSGGISQSTVVFFGNIPIKYLKRIQ